MGMKFRLLDLFSGIGGFSLGLERSGFFETVALCEIEEYPRRVLAKHWPKVPIYGDIRELDRDRLVRDGIADKDGRIDAICGGFPCQDISFAGKGAGIRGERSGLWTEYARLIGELRPRYVIVENVAALLGRGMGVVLGDLSALGYDAEWRIISAADVGAPHLRERVWIVAYCHEEWTGWRFQFPQGGEGTGYVADAHKVGSQGRKHEWVEYHIRLTVWQRLRNYGPPLAQTTRRSAATLRTIRGTDCLRRRGIGRRRAHRTTGIAATCRRRPSNAGWRSGSNPCFQWSFPTPVGS